VASGVVVSGSGTAAPPAVVAAASTQRDTAPATTTAQYPQTAAVPRVGASTPRPRRGFHHKSIKSFSTESFFLSFNSESRSRIDEDFLATLLCR
jgi:hypothetical protein